MTGPGAIHLHESTDTAVRGCGLRAPGSRGFWRADAGTRTAGAAEHVLIPRRPLSRTKTPAGTALLLILALGTAAPSPAGAAPGGSPMGAAVSIRTTGGGGGGGDPYDPVEDGAEWAPASEDDTQGGPDSVNPLLNADGSCAIDPDWPERRSVGPAGAGATIADGGAGLRQAREAHERRGRRVRLTWAQAGFEDVERVRRFLVVTASGAGSSRFRHPLLDPPGDVAGAPRVRAVGGSLTITRSPDMARCAMELELEYLE